LTIKNQIPLLFNDVNDFLVLEIRLIIDKLEGIVKYLLQDGRKQ
jgi:RNA polymerase sigma-70 factor (ECF subfamily)